MRLKLGRARFIGVLSVCLLGLAAVLAAQGPQGAPMPAGSGLIAGQVVELGGQPIAGAVVTLDGVSRGTAPRQPGTRPPDPVWAPKSVVTTAEGAFVFPTLPPGRYTLTASATGLQMDDRMTRTPPTVELGDNDRHVGVRITLARDGAISGRVVDDLGDPAVGAHVTIFARSAAIDTTRFDTVTTVVADDRGIYRASRLLPGQYLVGIVSATSTLPVRLANAFEANKSNPTAVFNLFVPLTSNDIDIVDGLGMRVGDFVYQRAYGATANMLPPDEARHVRTAPTVFYPNASQWTQAGVIALKSGEEHGGVDLTTHVVPGVVVSGILNGPDGPMPSMGVRLTPTTDGTSDGDSIGAVLLGGGRAVTDERGRFVFMGIPAGQYQLLAVQMVGTRDSGSTLWSSQTLNVGGADITGLVLSMHAGTKISGRIVVANAAPKVEPNLAGLVLGLRPAGNKFWRGGRILIAPDATFTSVGDTAGTYMLELFLPGWSIAGVQHGGRDVADEPIEIGADDLTDFVVTITNKTAGVTGAVVDASGTPATHACVILFPADAAARRGPVYSRRRFKRVDTSSTGTFDITGLPAGEYMVAAVDTDLTDAWLDPAFFDRVMPGAARVVLGEADEKSLSLKLFIPRD